MLFSFAFTFLIYYICEKFNNMKSIDSLTLKELFEDAKKYDVKPLLAQWDTFETPTHIRLNNKSVSMAEVWNKLTYGQRLFISEIDWKSLSGESTILTMLSIMLYSFILDEKFNEEKHKDLFDKILKLNAFECYKASAFFLSILNSWYLTNRINLNSNRPKKRKRAILKDYLYLVASRLYIHLALNLVFLLTWLKNLNIRTCFSSSGKK